MTHDAASADGQDAAMEAAQRVVNDVTSYEYSGEENKVRTQLVDGFAKAHVEVPEDEVDRLVDEIEHLKRDQDAGIPRVRQAKAQ